jgi:putative ABC transport system ATP-binding protein
MKTQAKPTHSSPHANGKPVIELAGVYKSYFMESLEVPILKDINITVREGEFVAIMGPSGSGKSTLMNLVGCLDVPTQGKVFLDGHDITKLSDNHLARIRGSLVGFVFQKFNLINSLTAWENVALPLIFHSTPADERKAVAIRVLTSVGMADRVNNHPNQLSGGQQQRVAIARALAVTPQMILADEPTGNLDSVTGKEILSLFGSLNAEGKTIVLVTHDENVARNARRIIRISDGRVVSDEVSGHVKKRGSD